MKRKRLRSLSAIFGIFALVSLLAACGADPNSENSDSPFVDQTGSGKVYANPYSNQTLHSFTDTGAGWDQSAGCTLGAGSYQVSGTGSGSTPKICYAKNSNYAQNFTYIVDFSFPTSQVSSTEHGAGLVINGDPGKTDFITVLLYPNGKYSFISYPNDKAPIDIAGGKQQLPGTWNATTAAQKHRIALVNTGSNYEIWIDNNYVSPAVFRLFGNTKVGVTVSSSDSSPSEAVFSAAEVWS